MKFKVGDIVEAGDVFSQFDPGRVVEIVDTPGFPYPVIVSFGRKRLDYLHFREDELRHHVDLNALLNKYYNLA
jgi:hypothetical protein